MGTEAPVRNFRETDSWLIRGILLSSFLTAAGSLCGVVVLWGARKKITQRRRVYRAGAESEKNEDDTAEMAGVPVLPLAVFPLIFPCLYYVTHADLRYRQPIDPVVLLLTMLALAQAWRFVGARSRPTNECASSR